MKRTKGKVTFRRGFKKWSDDLSIDLRKKLDLKKVDPLCAFELCKYLNIPVYTPSDFDKLSKPNLKVLLGNGSHHWSAATIPIGDNQSFIIHNPTHSPQRQQSNLMHELAHILCGHEVPQDKANMGLSGFLRNYDQEQEDEAEWLGSCLQIPRPGLLWALKNKMTESEIAEHFNASRDMVRYRINITGVRKQLSYMRT